MMTFRILQTASHGVLVVCTQDIDPTSISVEISAAKDAIRLMYRTKEEGYTMHSIYPRLCPTESKPMANALIEGCTHSVSQQNLVLRMEKLDSPYDWESLDIHTSKKDSSLSAGYDTEKMGREGSLTRLKFVTEDSVRSLQEIIQVSDPWGGSGMLNDMVVGNVSAQKVPTMNAIEITAALTPKSPK